VLYKLKLALFSQKKKQALSMRVVLSRGGGMGMTSSSSQEYA
jgi:hypothetical protein